MNHRINEIEALITKANIAKAAERLMDFARDFGNSEQGDTTLLIKKHLSEVTEASLAGTLSFDNTHVETARIGTRILKSVRLIQQTYQETIKKENQQTEIQHYQAGLNPDTVLFHGIHLSKQYEHFKLEVPEIKLQSGKITALVGHNGSGKSTLLKIVAGIINKQSGDYFYPAMTENWFERKQKIAYVSQILPFWLISPQSNLEFEAILHEIENHKTEVEKFLYRFDLQHFRNKKWDELSGGYKVRFELAKALIKRPYLLLLDEPLAQLDVVSQIRFLENVRDFANSAKFPMAVLLTSHHLEVIESIADDIIFLENGTVKYYGKPTNMQFKTNILEINCDCSKEILLDVLQKIDTNIDLKVFGIYFKVIIPTYIEVNTILSQLIIHEIKILYFKDMSKSTKRFF